MQSGWNGIWQDLAGVLVVSLFVMASFTPVSVQGSTGPVVKADVLRMPYTWQPSRGATADVLRDPYEYQRPMYGIATADVLRGPYEY